jgi:small subunit ribosomal protein S20
MLAFPLVKVRAVEFHNRQYVLITYAGKARFCVLFASTKKAQKGSDSLIQLTLWGRVFILRHLRQTRWGADLLRFWRRLMPNHKSSEKRVRQSEKRRVINRSNRTKVRTYIKKLRAALDSGKNDDVQSVLPDTISVIDKAVQKGVMHKNAAARYKSRLTVRANQVAK